MIKFNINTKFEDLENFLNEHGLSADRDTSYSVWKEVENKLGGTDYVFFKKCFGIQDLIDFCNIGIFSF